MSDNSSKRGKEIEAELIDQLEELASDWADVASWGKRENQSRYQKGLKDATRDKSRELQEVIEEVKDERSPDMSTEGGD